MKQGLSLQNKKALITGAARGIGKSITATFTELGADLVLADINRSTFKKTADQIRKSGQKIHPIVADITDLRQIQDLVQETVQTLGTVDILVNNAGVVFLNPAEELTEEQWDKTLAVNLKGLFFLTQEVGKHMIRQKSGKIINISSQAGIVGLESHAAYCASKAGVIAITKVLAVEWGKYNINVNAIAPTVIMTPSGKKAWSGEKRDKMLEKIPLGKFGKPKDVAFVAAFLASDNSSMITGATVMIDGGYTAQ